MSRHYSIYTCTLLLLIGVLHAAVWRVTNRRITKDGEPFLVQGVNYAPIPPGSLPTEATQWGDMFHTDWAHLHDRDIPMLRAAGVNSIRVYHLQLTYSGSNTPLDHDSFFDKLYNNGEDPIYIFITYALSAKFAYLGPYNTRPDTVEYAFQTTNGQWYTLDTVAEQQNAATREMEKNVMIGIAARYRDHPAVMGFVIGNEQNDMITRSNCNYWAWLDEIDAAVKQQAPNLLTATTIVDDAMITIRESVRCNALIHMDIWGINSYRGTATTGFDVLFSDFAGLISDKGLLITEFGCPASTRVDGEFAMLPENSRLQADYLETHWNDILNHADICSGGHVFSWIDEWWKNSDPNSQTPNNVAQNGAFPGQWADEEAWGLVSVVVDCDEISNWAERIDQVEPRYAYYTMGKIFGAWTEVPPNASEPLRYPLCNGKWIGAPPEIPAAPVAIDVPLPLPAPGQPIPEPDQPLHATPIATAAPVVGKIPTSVKNQESSALRVRLSLCILLFLASL
jgi:hypothetical protein